MQHRHRPNPKRGFTPEEDAALVILVQQYGYDWNRIADIMATMFPWRPPKSYRERYMNYILPGTQQEWTQAEDEILMTMHHERGTSWKPITSKFPHRSEQNVKNRYNWLHRKEGNNTRKNVAETLPKELPSASDSDNATATASDSAGNIVNTAEHQESPKGEVSTPDLLDSLHNSPFGFQCSDDGIFDEISYINFMH